MCLATGPWLGFPSVSAAQWLKWLQSLACQTPLGARQLFSIAVALPVKNTFSLRLAARRNVIEKIDFENVFNRALR